MPAQKARSSIKNRKSGSARETAERRPQARWEVAFRQAMKDYGSRAQAERIAWGAVDQAIVEVQGQVSRKKV